MAKAKSLRPYIEKVLTRAKKSNDFNTVKYVKNRLTTNEGVKKLISENYIKTGKITDDEWKFCDRIDWHPVDELPLKEAFVKRLQKAKKEKSIKLKSVDDLFK